MAYIRIYLNDVLIDQVEFNEGRLSIGRAPDSDIVLDNGGVSSHHAVIEKDEHGFVLSDNGSTNGVYVNGDKIDRCVLKYWDEIQVYNYVLKFMAVPHLLDKDDPDLAQDAGSDQAGTMEVSISDVQDLLKLRKQKKDAYLELPDQPGAPARVGVKGTRFSIGRSRTADLRAGGWFAPAVAAEILRQADGYYLQPHKRGQVQINGKAITETTRLHDGDRLRIRNLSADFFHRVSSAA